MALKVETSAFLDKAMDAALKMASASGWTDEGKIIFIQNRMSNAYAVAREIEDNAS